MFLLHLIKERKAKIRISGIEAEFETLMRTNTVHIQQTYLKIQTES